MILFFRSNRITSEKTVCDASQREQNNKVLIGSK